MGKAERQARRRAAVTKLKGLVVGGVQRLTRALDEEDIEAAQALAVALITFAPGGYSKEEWAAIRELWESLHDGLSDSP